MSKAKALFILDPGPYDWIYGPAERAEIGNLVDVYAPPQTAQSIREHPELLRDVQVILSGWGAPVMDEAFLDQAPNLQAVFYGAGSIRGIVDHAFWQRGLVITSAYGANAVPVAIYTLSQVLFSLKHGWRYGLELKRTHRYPEREQMLDMPGTYTSMVGIISLGMVGSQVCELLKPFNLKILAYDPFAGPETAKTLGVELCALDDVFRRADVVSLHTPWLKETEGMITGAHFASMKRGATFINTARGAVVREPEMIAVLEQRPDLFALLDVVFPEPPAPDSPLFTLSNVIVTPHIAGAVGTECQRMGRYMVEELTRYLHGEALQWGITEQKAKVLA
jgi:phosphoglycerate dehydrogenase-like enzyme